MTPNTINCAVLLAMLISAPRGVAQTNVLRKPCTNQEPKFDTVVRSSSPYMTNVTPGIGIAELRKIKPSFDAVVEKKTNSMSLVMPATNHVTAQWSEIFLKTSGGQRFVIIARNPGSDYVRLYNYLEIGKRYRFPQAILDAESSGRATSKQ